MKKFNKLEQISSHSDDNIEDFLVDGNANNFIEDVIDAGLEEWL